MIFHRGKTEGRKRGWGFWEEAATPSHQLGALEECCELPQRGSGRSPDRPKVFHYFQHSGWPDAVVYCYTARSAAQRVIGPLCVFVCLCVFVGLLPR